MARVLIRNLDKRAVARLKERARRNGRSLEAELRIIIEQSLIVDVIDARALAARIRRKLGNRNHTDSTSSVAEDRRR